MVDRYQYQVKGKADPVHDMKAYMGSRTIVPWAGIHNLYSDSLQAGRSGDRIPIGVRFSASVHTGPRAHPASYTMGTGSFPGIKRPRFGVDHPPHLAPRLKKE